MFFPTKQAKVKNRRNNISQNINKSKLQICVKLPSLPKIDQTIVLSNAYPTHNNCNSQDNKQRHNCLNNGITIKNISHNSANFQVKSGKVRQSGKKKEHRNSIDYTKTHNSSTLCTKNCSTSKMRPNNNLQAHYKGLLNISLNQHIETIAYIEMISANLSSHHTNSIHANNDTHTNDNEAQVHINSSSCADDMANNHNHVSNRNQNYNSTCNMKSGHKKSTHKLLTQKKKSVVDKQNKKLKIFKLSQTQNLVNHNINCPLELQQNKQHRAMHRPLPIDNNLNASSIAKSKSRRNSRIDSYKDLRVEKDSNTCQKELLNVLKQTKNKQNVNQNVQVQQSRHIYNFKPKKQRLSKKLYNKVIIQILRSKIDPWDVSISPTPQPFGVDQSQCWDQNTKIKEQQQESQQNEDQQNREKYQKNQNREQCVKNQGYTRIKYQSQYLSSHDCKHALTANNSIKTKFIEDRLISKGLIESNLFPKHKPMQKQIQKLGQNQNQNQKQNKIFKLKYRQSQLNKNMFQFKVKPGVNIGKLLLQN